MHRLLIAVAFVLCAAPAAAQSLSIAFNQEGPDLATVAAFTYTLSVNGGARVPITVTCTGNVSPFTCLMPFDPSLYTPSQKTQMNVITCEGVLCSIPSASLNFVVPMAARNLRIQ